MKSWSSRLISLWKVVMSAIQYSKSNTQYFKCYIKRSYPFIWGIRMTIITVKRNTVRILEIILTSLISFILFSCIIHLRCFDKGFLVGNNHLVGIQTVSAITNQSAVYILKLSIFVYLLHLMVKPSDLHSSFLGNTNFTSHITAYHSIKYPEFGTFAKKYIIEVHRYFSFYIIAVIHEL